MSEDLTGRLVDADQAVTPEGHALRSMTQLPALAAHPAVDGTSVGAYDPLYDPADDASRWAPPLDVAIDRARKVLGEKGEANIHDQDAMIRAATGLEIVLRDLLAALDKEAGQ